MVTTLTLETDRLKLRRLTPGDLPFLVAYNADPVLMRYFPAGKKHGEAETRAALEKALRLYAEDDLVGPLGVSIKSEGDRLVGRCGLQWYEVEVGVERPRAYSGRGAAPPGVRTETVLELGYGLVPEVWGRGLATEAVLVVRDAAFGRGEARLMSVIHPENLPSIRVAERNGMALRGELEVMGEVFHRYELTREEWGR